MNKHTNTTDTNLPTAVAAAIAALCCYVLSACTGPFGVVVGGADVHKLYNERVAIEQSKNPR